MSRRNYAEQSWIDYIKSIGCVVYIPLNADGAIVDLINNVSAVPTGAGVFEFNQQEGMYRIKQPYANNTCAATVPNGFSKTWFPTDSFTTIGTFKKITSQSGKYARNITPNCSSVDTAAVIAGGYRGTGNLGVYPSYTFKYYANVDIDNNHRRHATNDGWSNDYAMYNPTKPSNWVLDGTGLKLGYCYSASPYGNVEYYTKGLYVFNRALTDEERDIIWAHD